MERERGKGEFSRTILCFFKKIKIKTMYALGERTEGWKKREWKEKRGRNRGKEVEGRKREEINVARTTGQLESKNKVLKKRV